MRADEAAVAALDARVRVPLGDDSEIRRFSYVVVPLGKVPSTGMALTGRDVAAAGHHRGGHRADELGRGGWDDGMSGSRVPA